MEPVLSRVLMTFAAGFAVIGLVAGFITSNTAQYCGSVLNHDSGCSQPASMIALLVVCWGLALTCVIGAVVVDVSQPKPPSGHGSDLIDHAADARSETPEV